MFLWRKIVVRLRNTFAIKIQQYGICIVAKHVATNSITNTEVFM